MKKTMFLFLYLLIALMLTSCQIHIDTDPWPASPGYGDTEATIAPTDTPVAATEEAAATAPPQPTNEDFIPVITPTPQPSNDVVEPGFNG